MGFCYRALLQRRKFEAVGGIPNTAIVIAHRLSTVRVLGRILVFAAGRIVEDGTHDDLLTVTGGHYRRLFERQAGSAMPEIA